MYIKFVHIPISSLGLEYLSAALKKDGHRVDLIIDYGFKYYRKRLIKEILKDNPDIVGFSVMNSNIEWALDLSESIKRLSSVPIVFGGTQATLTAEYIITKEYIDFVVIGEGEFALPDLLNNLKDKDSYCFIDNLWYKKNCQIIKNPLRKPIDNLDDLPFPDKDLFREILSTSYYITTSRGCCYDCTYCCAPALRRISEENGRFIRRCSPENVIKELKIAKKKNYYKKIFFDDEIFTFDKQWLKKFSFLYGKEIGLPCTVVVHPNHVTEEIVSYLRKMNCRAVEIGVQSLNENIRKFVLKRYYSNDSLKRVFSILKKNKILCSVDNIIGLPNENLLDIQEMVEFYNEMRPGKIEIFYLKYFPKTEIGKIAGLDNNVLKKIDNGEINATGIGVNKKEEVGLLNIDVKETSRLILVCALIYIFPKKMVNYILKKKLYRFFPCILNANFINNVVFHFTAIFHNYRYSVWAIYRELLIREMRLKIKFLIKDIIKMILFLR